MQDGPDMIQSKGMIVTIMAVAMLAMTPIVQAESLQSLYTKALNNNPTYARSKTQIDVAESVKDQATASFLPTITAARSVNRIVSVNNSRLTGDNNQNIFTINQNLFNAQVYYRYKQANLNIEQQELLEQLAQQRLMIELSQNYINVLFAKKQLELAQEEEKSSSKLADRLQQFLEVGTGRKVDYLQADANLKLNESRTISAKFDVESNKSALQSTVGMPIGQLDEIDFSLNKIIREKNQMSQVLSELKNNNKQLLATQKATQAAKQNTHAVSSQQYPTFALSFNKTDTDYVTQSDVLQDSEVDRVSLSINWTLFDGLSNYARIDEASALERSSYFLEKELERDLVKQAEQVLIRINSAIDQLPALEALLEAREAALEATQESFNVGLTEFVEVVNARRDIVASATNLYQAELQLWLDVMQLKFISGRLNVDDL